MAKLTSAKNIGSDVYEAADKWGKQLIDILNPFIRDVFGALSKNLTLADNLSGQIREFTFTTKSNYTAGTAGWDVLRYSHGLAVKATEVRILQVNEVGDNEPVITSAVTLDWTEAAGEIKIRYVAGLANSRKYKLRLHSS